MAVIKSVVAELGIQSVVHEGLVIGHSEVVPEACVPGTSILRTSVIGTWADVITGIIAGYAIDPRIPLTLDLEVHILNPARVGTRIISEATPVKVGRTVTVCEATFRDEQSGEPLAVSICSFIASPDPSHVFPGGFPLLEWMDQRLTQPLAERIGSRTIAPGMVEVPHRPDGLNASGAIQGGLLAFAAEEAALSMSERTEIVESLNLRYLRPFSAGPARAVATGTGVASIVRLTDVGAGKLGAIATVRLGAVR
jgi:acyl-coenzyme A thioesterase PaaI-like protein